jgi:hypothetical protein
MTDWSGALARAFRNHIDFSGSSGSSGSDAEKANVLRGLDEPRFGTTADERVVPVVPAGRRQQGRNHWNHWQNEVVLDAPNRNIKQDQDLSGFGTTGTTGTTEFEVTCANENFEERAALVEYGADVPRDKASRGSPLRRRQPGSRTRLGGRSLTTLPAFSTNGAGRLQPSAGRRSTCSAS